MDIMITEVYDALKEAGVSEEKAIAASKAIAEYKNYHNNVESNLNTIQTELKVIKWMFSLVIIAVFAVLVQQFITK